ncbi:MAG: type II toxin-antitoxin system VapC family toxin [Candidatus Binataceae bacterium]
MPDKVVDASVVVALAFGEPLALTARDLLEGATLYAPDLLPYEICSAALAKSRRYPGQFAAIAAGMSLALTLDVNLRSVPAAEILELAIQSGLTAYDAAYLWLARRLQCQLLTFDQRLARAANTT